MIGPLMISSVPGGVRTIPSQWWGPCRVCEPYVSTWLRYIDNDFVIWEGSEKTLFEFFKMLMTSISNYHGLTRKVLPFLTFGSIVILRGNYAALGSIKALLGTQCCMHADSFHPTTLKNSILYGQYLRLRKNCSYDTLFGEEAGRLQNRLLERGYSRSCLCKAYNRTVTKSRHELLYKHKPQNNWSN